MQLRHTIHLYFEHDRYVAAVPGLPDCHAYGASYAEALGQVELMLGQRARSHTESCLDSTGVAGIDTRSEAGNRCSSSVIKARLVEKFGRLSNRQLAASIGIVAPDAPVMLSSALGGKGSRQVRCAIASALNELPSQLWPNAAGRIRAMDDSCFLSTRRGVQDASSIDDDQAASDVHADEPVHRHFS